MALSSEYPWLMLAEQLSRAATTMLWASRWLASEVDVVPRRFSPPAEASDVSEIPWCALRDEIARTGARPLWPTRWVGAVQLTLREASASRRRQPASPPVSRDPDRDRGGSGAPWLPLRGFIVRTWGDVRWPERFSVRRFPVVARYHELVELQKRIDLCQQRLEALEKSNAA